MDIDMKIGELVTQATDILRDNKVRSCVLDAQLLLAHYLKVDKLFVINNRNCDLAEYDGYFDYISRRAKHEPIAYIIGNKEFYGLDFYVDHNVLIPRPDTEILVESIIDIAKNKRKKMLDIGTGSGCISVSCLANCKHLNAVGLDISESALEIAQKNAENNNVKKRFSTIKCDILSGIPDGKYDIIVSNPPYIEPGVIAELEPDVKDYEPYSALYGGEDGLDFYRRISAIGKSLLNDKYVIAFEVGHTQSNAVAEILKKDGYDNITAVNDLSGIKRVVIARSSKF